MPSYLIEHHHAENRDLVGGRSTLHNCASPMAAVQLAAEIITWARGFIDRDLGVMWPFNPDILVDGVPAYRIAAAEFGGTWADAAARRDGLQVAA